MYSFMNHWEGCIEEMASSMMDMFVLALVFAGDLQI